MRITIAILACILLAACGGPKPSSIEDLGKMEVDFPNGTKILCDPARTQLEIMQGLMYRDVLAPDRGMLFIYPKPDKHPFWMYKATFPVDILWMDRDHRIVEMSLNTPPCPSKAAHECPRFGGQKDSRFVLEVKAGIATQNGLRFGDRLDF
jgi:uncharacterized membrane protein (UPF0127 family)